MFLFAHIDSITLPLEDPILKFLLILVIILAAPLILNKLKIPYLLGLIIAGAVIGPHGLNLVLRDSSIILSGTAGLLYIMFLSGLDMDMSDFRRNSWRSLVFGLYTFCVPLGLGILAGYYVMGFPLYSSILLAGLFGVLGLTCAALMILAMACGSEPFGYDYLYPLMPPGRASVRDGFVRSIWSRLAKSGEVISRHEA